MSEESVPKKGMLRHPTKAEGMPSSISSYPYRRVKVEPLGSDPRRVSLQDRRPWGYLRKAGVAMAVAVVIFLAIWNHLFAVDVGSVTVENGKVLPPQSTFTVRYVRVYRLTLVTSQASARALPTSALVRTQACNFQLSYFGFRMCKSVVGPFLESPDRIVVHADVANKFIKRTHGK